MAVARTYGVSAECLFAGLPVDVASLEDPTTRVPIAICEAILARAIDLTNEPTLAARLGRRMRCSAHGFLGFAAMTAETVRDALGLAVRFAPTRSPAIGVAMFADGPTATLVLDERGHLPPLVRRAIVIAVFTGLVQLARAVTDFSVDILIEFAFEDAGDVRELPKGVKVRFGAPAHRFVFPASLLDARIISADRVASRLAREQCERELARLDPGQGGIETRVRRMIASEEHRHASLEEVAQSLKMSARTLKRKLADAQLTFSEIRNEVQRQRALLLLDNRELSVGDVAARLGYSEVANFTRAFRKWTGTTPLAYRSRSESA